MQKVLLALMLAFSLLACTNEAPNNKPAAQTKQLAAKANKQQTAPQATKAKQASAAPKTKSEVIQEQIKKLPSMSKGSVHRMALSFTAVPSFEHIITQETARLDLSKEQLLPLFKELEEKRAKEISMLQAFTQNNQDLHQAIISKKNSKEINVIGAKINAAQIEWLEHQMSIQAFTIDRLGAKTWENTSAAFASKNPYQVSKKGGSKVLRSASRLPNLTQTALTAKPLELNEEQKSSITEWQTKQQATLLETANEIINLKHQIFEAALKQKNKAATLALVKQYNSAFNKLIALNIEDRDFLSKNVLNDEQWAKLKAVLQ